jgi:hypothetical protein
VARLKRLAVGEHAVVRVRQQKRGASTGLEGDLDL